MRLSSFLTRPAKYRKPVDSDPQRYLVYTMERLICGSAIHTHCDREHLEAILKNACRVYKVKVPKLTIFHSKERVFGRSHDDEIRLNASFHGDNVSTLLHELAHYIHWQDPDCEKQHDHGPEFMSIYADLLDRYRLMPYCAFMTLCDDFNIEVS